MLTTSDGVANRNRKNELETCSTVQVHHSLNLERMGRHGKNQTASAVYGYRKKKKDTGESENVASDNLTKVDFLLNSG